MFYLIHSQGDTLTLLHTSRIKFEGLPNGLESCTTAPAVHTNPKIFLNRIFFSRMFVWMSTYTTLESVLKRRGFGEHIHWFVVDDRPIYAVS